MKNRRIESIGDLRAEIIRLQFEVDARELIIKAEVNHIAEQVKAPFQFIKRVSAWFGGGIDESTKAASTDWVTSIFQLGFPYFLNSVIFRRSGLIMKGLVALASQKAVSGINVDTLTGWVEQLSHWIKKQGKKNTKSPDYGIPPDSETF